MMWNRERLSLIKELLVPLLDGEFELNYVVADNGDFGDLVGLQFDSQEYGGFLYFWSSGVVEFNLVSYKDNCSILPLTTIELSDDDFLEQSLTQLLDVVARICKKEQRKIE